MMRDLFIVLIIHLCCFSLSFAELQPRWIPPKPDEIETIDPEHFHQSLITVKFAEGNPVRLRNGKLVSLNDADLSSFKAILNGFKIRKFKRLFSRPEEILELERTRGQQRSGKQLADLNNYYLVALDSSANPEAFMTKLLSLDLIEYTSALPKPSHAEDIPPETPDFTNFQGYLENAPGGINARYAWSYQGGKGDRVKIVDIETAWSWDHEDLKEPFFHDGLDRGHPHGDAVIGILIAQHNGYGVDGICPDAEIGGQTILQADFQVFADAINRVTENLDEGDFYLIEMQNEFRDFLSPMETWQEVFDAIETASANGFICLEAAGNGNSNLDDELYEGRFDPENRHSGAIIVGAGNPPFGEWGRDRARAEFSNYGQRVDLQGWGSGVTTTGMYGDLFNPQNDVRQKYTRNFNGTSSATPIVAGAAACLQSILKARTENDSIFNPMQLRDLLVQTGSDQRNGHFGNGHIGPRPDLQAAIELLPFPPGVIYGTVLSAQMDDPLRGVRISTNNGFEAETNEAGMYRIDYVPSNQQFRITANLAGYTSVDSGNFILEEGDSLEVNFELFHPEFWISEDPIDLSITGESYLDLDFSIENSGDADLEWNLEWTTSPDNIDPWDHILSINAGEVVDDYSLEGIVFAQDMYYVSGSNRGDPLIYVLNRNGELINQFAQVGCHSRGLRDLAWDGVHIWGVERNVIFEFTTEGELVDSIAAPVPSLRGIACDTSEALLWICGMTSNIFAVTAEGETIDEIENPGLQIYGLSWRQIDPESTNVYIYGKDIESDLHLIHKFNPRDGMIDIVAEISPEAGGAPGGAFITDKLLYNQTVFINISNNSPNNGGDRIDLWQLESYDNWFCVDTNRGLVEPDDIQELVFTFDTHGLPLTDFQGSLLFSHNTIESLTEIPVLIRVTQPQKVEHDGVIHNSVNPNLLSYPNPFNSIVRIEFKSNRKEHFRLDVFDVSGRLINTLFNGQTEQGEYLFDWNAENLPSGIYFIHLTGKDNLMCTNKLLLMR